MAGTEVYKECLAFKKRTGRWPRAQIRIGDARLFKKGITERFEKGLIEEDLYEELMEEISLFNRWKNCPERKILTQYEGVPMDRIPKKYQKMIDTLRGFGLGYPGGKIDIVERMESFYRKHGRAPEWVPIERDKLSEKEVIERRLYERFITSEENKLSKKYIDTPLEEIPEEHQDIIRRLRAIGVGANGRKLTALEEYMAFVREYAREPIHYINPVGDEQIKEHDIKQRWRVCNAKFTFEKYKGVLLSEIPEADRQVVSDLRQMWIEVDGAHVMEEYFSFIDTYKREPRDFNQGRSTFGRKLTEEELKEADLASRWNRCFEKQVMDRFSKYKNIPKGYKDIISLLREHDLAYPESFNTRMFIKYVYQKGFVPRQVIVRDGKRVQHKYYSQDELFETSIRIKFDISEEKQIYEKYRAGILDEKTAKIYSEMLQNLDRAYQIDERNRAHLSMRRKEHAKVKNSRKRAADKLAKLREEAEKAYQKSVENQREAGEKRIADDEERKKKEYVDEVVRKKLAAQKARDAKNNKKKTSPNKDEKEAEIARKKEEQRIKKEQELKQSELDSKKDAIELAKIFIDFVKGHGRFPRETIKRQGFDIKKDDLTPEERTEQLLRRAWDRCNFMEVVDAYAGTPIESLPVEYQETIAEFRSEGFGLTSDEYYKYRNNLTPDQVLRYVKNTRDMTKSKKVKAMKLEQEVLEQLRQIGKEKDDE